MTKRPCCMELFDEQDQHMIANHRKKLTYKEAKDAENMQVVAMNLSDVRGPHVSVDFHSAEVY